MIISDFESRRTRKRPALAVQGCTWKISYTKVACHVIGGKGKSSRSLALGREKDLCKDQTTSFMRPQDHIDDNNVLMVMVTNGQT